MMPRHLHRWYTACLIAPLLACCLASTASAVASQIIAARIDTATTGLTPMCAWARNGQVGLWWNVSISPARAFANAHHYNAVCVALPWMTAWPHRGSPFWDVGP